jgi:hypothetical protein
LPWQRDAVKQQPAFAAECPKEGERDSVSIFWIQTASPPLPWYFRFAFFMEIQSFFSDFRQNSFVFHEFFEKFEKIFNCLLLSYEKIKK